MATEPAVSAVTAQENGPAHFRRAARISATAEV